MWARVETVQVSEGIVCFIINPIGMLTRSKPTERGASLIMRSLYRSLDCTVIVKRHMHTLSCESIGMVCQKDKEKRDKVKSDGK